MNLIYVIIIVIFAIILTIAAIVLVPKLIKWAKSRNSGDLKVDDTVIPDSAETSAFSIVELKDDAQLVDSLGDATTETIGKGIYEMKKLIFNERKVIVEFVHEGNIKYVLKNRKKMSFRFN